MGRRVTGRRVQKVARNLRGHQKTVREHRGLRESATYSQRAAKSLAESLRGTRKRD